MDYRAPTIAMYDRYPDDFDRKFGEYFDLYLRPFAQAFLAKLPGKRVADLGCGPGHDAAYFRAYGCDMVCVDGSEAMVRRCAERGLDARQGYLEEIDDVLAGEQFDGLWVYAALLHIPKEQAPDVVARLAKLLPPGGILGIAVKQGEGEGFEPHRRLEGERFFSYFSEAELRALLEPWFVVEEFSSTNVEGKYVFMNAVGRRK